MNPFDYSKAVADFWTAQGQAFMKAQQQAGKALAEGMQAVASGTLPTMPEMPTDLSASVADLATAGQSVMEMWSAATAMSGKLATTFPAAEGGNTTVEATFRKMIDPRSWMAGTGEIDDVLGRMAEGPRFADLWEVERHYARVLQAWMNVRRRGLEHSAVVLEAWLQAGRRFAEDMAGRAGTETQAPDAKAVLALWTETANRQLLETQRSEPFLADAGGDDPRQHGTAHGAAGVGRAFRPAVRLPDPDGTGRRPSHGDRASPGGARDAAGAADRIGRGRTGGTARTTRQRQGEEQAPVRRIGSTPAEQRFSPSPLGRGSGGGETRHEARQGTDPTATVSLAWCHPAPQPPPQRGGGALHPGQRDGGPAMSGR